MKIVLIVFFIFFSFAFSKEVLSAKTLHAILIADTVHDISNITQPDLRSWQKEIRSITCYAKMDLSEKIFCGGEFKKEKVKEYLQSLKVGKKDSVIFYFSGHGYRTMHKKTPWPYLTFEYHKPGLDVHWVAKTIRSKKPQFTLVMSDCCNNYMENGMFGKESKNILMNLKKVSPAYSGYAQLFSNAKGEIVVSSCSEGQFSYGSHLGGLYTQCFFTSLYRELQEEKPSWKHLLERANGFIGHIQRPICEVYR